ncbi:hypothetical protein GCM10011579_001970 [Streptomyces albiflavescens]|uniref:Uncharacterized protein n=1 Tax=Streptomyces albiflavescens TaxID=1623582 RepID=A0A918CY90_9ACTN|nr:hypothetical protein [Streptomyces albiflavescens]GGN48856.1 hypothetical protein GCM10011579_001970 [Streptomyces albiflavescens]
MSEVEALVRRLTPEDRAAVSLFDLQRLQVERAGVSEQTASQLREPTYGVLSCLRLWQVLIRRMEQDWPSTDYYMVYEYLNNLTVRDSLEEYVEALPQQVAVKIRRTLDLLDERYTTVTTSDGGAELSLYWRPLAEGREARWWWLRTPTVLPPGW